VRSRRAHDPRSCRRGRTAPALLVRPAQPSADAPLSPPGYRASATFCAATSPPTLLGNASGRWRPCCSPITTGKTATTPAQLTRRRRTRLAGRMGQGRHQANRRCTAGYCPTNVVQQRLSIPRAETPRKGRRRQKVAAGDVGGEARASRRPVGQSTPPAQADFPGRSNPVPLGGRRVLNNGRCTRAGQSSALRWAFRCAWQTV